MTTKTELANYALAHLGVQKVTDIDDPDSPTATTCAEFIDQVIDEVLRSHRWNCSVKRVALSEIVTAPLFEWEHQFQIPGDSLRVLEVNGVAYGTSDELFQIESGKVLLTNHDAVNITYVARIGVEDMDPLLAEACAIKLASKIIVPLSANLSLQEQMAALFERVLSRAKQCDAVETGSRENRPITRLMAGSILLNARYRGGYNPYQYGRYYVPWT